MQINVKERDNYMKKLIALLMVLAMTLAMVACANETNNTTTTNQPPQTTNSNNSDSTTQPQEPVVDDTLVEYYLQKANEVIVNEDSVTFTDDSGREAITIQKNPKKVAILYSSLTSLWYETGASAALIAGGKSSIELYNEQIGRDITQDEGTEVIVTSNAGSKWDVEAIIAQKPDLIICSMGMSGYKTIGATAEAAGIPVIGIQYDEVQDYLKWFKVFCNINGHTEKWEEVANATAQKIIEVVSKVPADAKKTKVAILGESSGKLMAYGTEAAAGKVLQQLGGVNVLDDGTEPFESKEIDLEQLYAANPDVILINLRVDQETTVSNLNAIVGDSPVWNGLQAVKNGVIYLEKGLFHNKPNHRYQEAYLVIAELLYPDTFK